MRVARNGARRSSTLGKRPRNVFRRLMISKSDQSKVESECGSCHKAFLVYRSKIKYGRGKFCSLSCKSKYFSGKNNPMYHLRGKYMGELASNWKGDSVGYTGIHMWVYSKMGQPQKCESCGTTKSKRFMWHNLSREYRRDIADWQRLCSMCHNHIHKNWVNRQQNPPK